MPVTATTRYGGTYEGGRWAAFDVDSWSDIPPEAFGGDVVAAEWWRGGSSILVGVGDSADEALEHLAYLNRQGADAERREGRYTPGSSVCVAACAPSDWHAGEVGKIVASRRDRLDGRFASSIRDEWVFMLIFEDGSTCEVPEPYLRRRA